MNIAQLKLSQKKLLDNLVSRGYDIQYIKGVKFVLRLLFEHEGCFHSYEQFAEKFIRTRGYTKATLDLRMMHCISRRVFALTLANLAFPMLFF